MGTAPTHRLKPGICISDHEPVSLNTEHVYNLVGDPDPPLSPCPWPLSRWLSLQHWALSADPLTELSPVLLLPPPPSVMLITFSWPGWVHPLGEKWTNRSLVLRASVTLASYPIHLSPISVSYFQIFPITTLLKFLNLYHSSYSKCIQMVITKVWFRESWQGK